MQFHSDRNSGRPQTQSIMDYSDCGFYRWSFIQESSQVSEIAVCQFPSVFDLGPEVVVCHKTIDDTKAAGKVKKKEHLLCDLRGLARPRVAPQM